MPADFAIVIGINDYPNFRSLNGAIDDADDFYSWVTDASGGNVPTTNCSLIKSTLNPVRPLQDDVDEAFLSIQNSLAGQAGRRFYLYFSGHGVGESYGDTAACLGKWSEQYRRAGLDVPGYIEMVAESGCFSEIAVFLDCCRVRLLNAGGNGPMIGLARPSSVAGETRTFVAYATEFQSLAYEAVIAGTDDGNRVRGYFTRALLGALRGGAAIATGGVPASRLKDYLERWTPIFAREQQRDQRPQIDNSLTGDPVFGAALPQANVRLQFDARRRGRIVLEDKDLKVIRADDAATGPWTLTIPAGLASVREQTSSESKTFRVLPDQSLTDVLF